LVESYHFRNDKKLKNELNEFNYFNAFINEYPEFKYNKYGKCWELSVSSSKKELYDSKMILLCENIENLSISKSTICGNTPVHNFNLRLKRSTWCNDKSNYKLIKNIHTTHHVINGEMCDSKGIPINNN
jgi:hypothetical protein